MPKSKRLTPKGNTKVKVLTETDKLYAEKAKSLEKSALLVATLQLFAHCWLHCGPWSSGTLTLVEGLGLSAEHYDS